MRIELIIIFCIATFVYISLELLRRKINLEEINTKSKEILDKLKSNPELDDSSLKELMDIQKKVYLYFIYSSIVLFGALFIVVHLIPDGPIITLPFVIPILNKNWLGPLGTYILFYFIISSVAGIIKKYIKVF
ncbi:MAG TPA: hypothetical protein EYH22_02645 [Candidatus Nanopusillus sp.]|nr:hypothetical protein [Candidatus Nanopusillus sp.]